MRVRFSRLLLGFLLNEDGFLRLLLDPLPTDGGGGLTDDSLDLEPINGGPDRGDLSNATIDEPAFVPAGSGAGAAPAAARTPADPNQRAGARTAPAPQAAQAAAAQWQSIREAAAAQGFQFDQTVTDDRTALNFLLRQAGVARQNDIHAQLGRQLAPHAGAIQGFLQQQSQPAAPAARPAWEAPEFDERWAGLVEQDPTTGLYIAKQGVPHDIAQKVNAYVEWKKNYDRNPAAVINGMVQAQAKEIARTTFQEQFQAQARDQVIGQIVAENTPWLFQTDASGRRAVDYQGQPIPTPVGAAYIQQLQVVRSMGVTDPRQQDLLAKELVRGQQARAYQAQHWASVNPQAQGAVHQPNVNALQALSPAQRARTPGATEPAAVGLSLSEQIRRDLAAEGVTDADVYASVTN